MPQRDASLRLVGLSSFIDNDGLEGDVAIEAASAHRGEGREDHLGVVEEAKLHGALLGPTDALRRCFAELDIRIGVRVGGWVWV